MPRNPASFREIISEEARSLLGPGADLDDHMELGEAGLSSLELVTLIFELESRLGLQFPPDALNLENFRSVATIARLVEGLGAVGPGAAQDRHG